MDPSPVSPPQLTAPETSPQAKSQTLDDTMAKTPPCSLPAEPDPGDRREDRDPADDPGTGSIDRAQEQKFLTGTRLHLVSTAFGIANIMVALDSSILATALPTISSNFGSTNDIGWYGSSYLLAQMASQPIWGKVYTCFEPKRTYLLSLIIFGVGSILCAASPMSACLILGRSVTGFAASGLLAGSLSIFGQVVPLRQRPQGMALMVSISNIASMIGSTIGGVVTDSVLTWRFCFWINVPLGVGCAIVVALILERKLHPDQKLPLKDKLQRIDLFSFLLLSSSLICLFLGFEWGGLSVSWSNSKAWGCLVGFALLGIAFIVVQAYKGDNAVINLKFMRQRTIVVCYIFSFLYGLAISTHQWLLPTYLQGIHYTSATLSGVICLAFSVPMTIFGLSTGFFTTRFGYYVPFMWAGSVLYVVGSVLLFRLDADSSPGHYIGYQILAGAGCGMAIQVTFIAVQVVVSPHDMAHACNMEVLFRQLGSSIAISLAENIFLSSVTSPLEKIVPGESSSILTTGIRSFVQTAKSLPSHEQVEVKNLLDYGITRAFILPLAATSAAAIASWAIEWRKIEEDREPPVLIEMS
ncbi:Aspyridones efflux protein [Penicillium longicatenatum]|uniref:Aspyridones efflux protein n=1 Tax=Penicillium longicatenatum TaxID=1561947 RepID=UPI0025496D61|nr:Aspyridones efflux protein [Penicillium longicatenatum]KAJ5658609.1 Aspyridones efflux protein [Penicillium longicatenatum]